MKLAEIIIKFRYETCVSQREFADMSGISLHAIQALERGQIKKIRLASLRNYAQAMMMEPIELRRMIGDEVIG